MVLVLRPRAAHSLMHARRAIEPPGRFEQYIHKPRLIATELVVMVEGFGEAHLVAAELEVGDVRGRRRPGPGVAARWRARPRFRRSSETGSRVGVHR